MKSVKPGSWLFVAITMFLFGGVAQAQDSTRNDTAGKNNRSDTAKKAAHSTLFSDDAFISDAVKMHEAEYRIARMAMEKVEHPRLTQLAREIMKADRDALTELSTINRTGNSEEGYNSAFLADSTFLAKTSKKGFEAQWLNMMAKMQDDKIDKMSTAIDATKEDKVRSAALSILPRARLLRDYIARAMKANGVYRN